MLCAASRSLAVNRYNTLQGMVNTSFTVRGRGAGAGDGPAAV